MVKVVDFEFKVKPRGPSYTGQVAEDGNVMCNILLILLFRKYYLTVCFAIKCDIKFYDLLIFNLLVGVFICT